MVHLPALVLSEQINQVIQAVNKIGLAVRGLYGEGTEALGNLFQVSNQTTLGEKEEEIIARLNKVIEQIIEHEQNARQLLLQKKPGTLLDHIGRAYGILSHAYSMTSKEALNLLSFMKLGIDLDFFPKNAGSRSTSFLWKRNPRICRKARSRNWRPRSATRCARRSSATS